MADAETTEDGKGRRICWRLADGGLVACDEKLRILEVNLAEVRQVCQDAFEDAVLMGCDETQVRAVFSQVIAELRDPRSKR